MKGFFGPYYRKDERDKWHWDECCPHFPRIKNPQTRLSTSVPDDEDLCKSCKAPNIANVNIDPSNGHSKEEDTDVNRFQKKENGESQFL